MPSKKQILIQYFSVHVSG